MRMLFTDLYKEAPFKLLTSVAFLGFIPSSAMAGGFAINENSASDLGRANTGRVVQIQDASAVFGNPALMIHYDHLTVSSTISHLSGDAEFMDLGSVDLTGQSLGGETDGFFDSAVVPAFHVIYPVTDRVAAGVSLNAPFGLSSTYDEGWPGRYQGLKSELITINVNPALAIKITDQFSIGGGVNLQYAHVELSTALDFGAVCFARLDPASCNSAGLTPQNADGRLDVEGDDWSFGYNIGAAYSPTPTVILGAHYRSRIRHDLSGDAEFTVPGAAQTLTMTGSFTDTRAAANLPLPASFELGVGWQATDTVSLYANFVHTQWSDLDEIKIDFENPSQPSSVEELDYENGNRYGVGGDVRVAANWTLRAGFSYDEGVSSDPFRTVRIPDNDRYIYAFGFSYTGFDSYQIDAAYNRLHVKDTDFSRIGPSNDRVVGRVESDVNIFSIGVTKRF